jgi:RNA polymerase sigma factor (sigma-70 family)
MTKMVHPPGDQEDRELIDPATLLEEELISYLKLNNAVVWDYTFKNYESQLQNDIRRLLYHANLAYDAQSCDDIQQQTWVTAVQNIKTFRWTENGKFYAWLKAIAQNHVWNSSRKDRRETDSIDTLDETVSDSGLHESLFYDDSLEGKLVLHDELSALDLIIRETVSGRDREILIRRLMLRESVHDLAAEYDLEPQTVSQIVSRAKKKLAARRDTISKLFGKKGS